MYFDLCDLLDTIDIFSTHVARPVIKRFLQFTNGAFIDRHLFNELKISHDFRASSRLMELFPGDGVG